MFIILLHLVLSTGQRFTGRVITQFNDTDPSRLDRVFVFKHMLINLVWLLLLLTSNPSFFFVFFSSLLPFPQRSCDIFQCSSTHRLRPSPSSANVRMASFVTCANQPPSSALPKSKHTSSKRDDVGRRRWERVRAQNDRRNGTKSRYTRHRRISVLLLSRRSNAPSLKQYHPLYKNCTAE